MKLADMQTNKLFCTTPARSVKCMQRKQNTVKFADKYLQIANNKFKITKTEYLKNTKLFDDHVKSENENEVSRHMK